MMRVYGETPAFEVHNTIFGHSVFSLQNRNGQEDLKAALPAPDPQAALFPDIHSSAFIQPSCKVRFAPPASVAVPLPLHLHSLSSLNK